MASVDYGLADGIKVSEDPVTGRISYTVIAHCKDLDPVADQTFGSAGLEMALIAQAMAMMPVRGSGGPLPGTVLLNREPEAYDGFPFDCWIKLNYGPPTPGTGTVKISGGGQVQQDQTDFDYVNRIKQLTDNTRKALEVPYDPSQNGAPGAYAIEHAQGATVPFWANKSSRTYERVNSYDPSGEADDYTGKTNSVLWKGKPPGVALCMSILYESNDGGSTYVTRYTFAFDPDTFWIPAARYTDPTTGKPPHLYIPQIAAQNGVIFPIVQGAIDLNGLHL